MSYDKKNKLHIVAVAAVIRRHDGRYLILKRSEREIAFPGMYGFPGGKVEGNDSIEETLAKEIQEEAGLIMKPGKILLRDVAFVRPDGQTVKVFSYLCTVESLEPVTVSEDFSEYTWVNREELQALHHVGIEEEIRQADTLFKTGIDLSLFVTQSIRREK